MRRRLLLPISLILLIFVLWFVIAPPQFFLNWVKPVKTGDLASAGKELVSQYQCGSCHVIANTGRSFGPKLDGVTKKIPEEQLRQWLLNPSKVRPGTPMPDLKLSDQEVDAIIQYLKSLDNG